MPSVAAGRRYASADAPISEDRRGPHGTFVVHIACHRDTEPVDPFLFLADEASDAGSRSLIGVLQLPPRVVGMVE